MNKIFEKDLDSSLHCQLPFDGRARNRHVERVKIIRQLSFNPIQPFR